MKKQNLLNKALNTVQRKIQESEVRSVMGQILEVECLKEKNSLLKKPYRNQKKSYKNWIATAIMSQKRL